VAIAIAYKRFAVRNHQVSAKNTYGRNRADALTLGDEQCQMPLMNKDTNPAAGPIRHICVYCGSSPGTDTAFIAAARAFGQILAENEVGLVYGGGSGGLMGALARSVRDHGGNIVGIIPEFLRVREHMFKEAQEIVVTRDMHERKRMMFERADAFVALPGGIGTLEELVEQLTWSQLGQHRKPIVIANIKGFWNALLEVIGHMKNLGFVHSGTLNYHVVDRVEDILPIVATTLQEVRPAQAADAEVIKRM
jgi:uncharacterized protein (TIGR00730 family)